MAVLDRQHYIESLPASKRLADATPLAVTDATSMSEIDDYLVSRHDDFEADLCELLRIPSISADSAHADDVRRAANWVHDHLQALGLTTELIETAGHPLVFAQSEQIPGKPTALVYGHYDVQPPDPLDEWVSPPFEPTVRDGNIYARGATDDKGQMLTHIKSAEAWMKTVGQLPLNVKYLIEGEEEVGSQSLGTFLTEHAARLACDCVVISDTCQFGPGRPAITYGLRGIAYYELLLKGPQQDLHSGSFGGAITNPANVLARLLAEIVDGEGRVQLPGFYDAVVPLTPREREGYQAMAFDDEGFLAQVGVDGAIGESGYSTLERRWARPSYDINGLWSGYQGEGAKTVLPARAGAKFSFRLVPNQTPEQVTAALREFLEPRLPPGITMELKDFHGSPGVLVSLESPYIEAAANAIEHGFGTAPLYIREGGSIPIVTSFAEHLGADVLLLGWGLSDDNTHSPNEKFCLADFHRGTKASAQLWAELAKICG